MEENSKDPLNYHPSKVSWAVAEFIATPPSSVARGFALSLALAVPLTLAITLLLQVPVTFEVTGRVLEAEPLVVTNSSARAVEAILVKPQQIVAKNEPLLKFQNAKRELASNENESVHSPISGVVMAIDTSNTLKITILPTTPSAFVTAEVPIENYAHIQVGTAVRVWLSGQGNSAPFDGKVIEVIAQLDDTQKHFLPKRKIRIEVLNQAFLTAAQPSEEVKVEVVTGQKRLLALIAEQIL